MISSSLSRESRSGWRRRWRLLRWLAVLPSWPEGVASRLSRRRFAMRQTVRPLYLSYMHVSINHVLPSIYLSIYQCIQRTF